MKILYLVPYTPTLIRTRPYNLLRALSRAGQQVTLFTLWEDEDERTALAALEKAGIEVRSFQLSRKQVLANGFPGIFSQDPLQAWYSWQPEMYKAIQQTVKNDRFDLVQIEHLRGGIYVRKLAHWIKRENLNTPLVWDAVDCISALFEQARGQSRSTISRLVARFELPRTKKMEHDLCRLVNRVLVTGKSDQQSLLTIARLENTPENVQVLPNGVDLEYFKPENESRAQDVVLFSGKLSYHANVSAANFLIQEIMPVVWKTMPQTRLQLVGKDPPHTLRALAETDRRIEIAANVPDLRPYLRRATLAAAPILYGAGIQNKVLEALACGTPIVATPQAVTGFEHLSPGVELIIAGSAEDFAKSILTLLENKSLRETLSIAGVEFVRRWHDWNQIARVYLAQTEQLIGYGPN